MMVYVLILNDTGDVDSSVCGVFSDINAAYDYARNHPESWATYDVEEHELNKGGLAW